MNSRETIIQSIAQELTYHAGRLTVSNVPEIQQEVSQLMRFAHYLVEVPNHTEPTESTDYYERRAEMPLEPVEEFRTPNTPDTQENVGWLDEKLANGYIQAGEHSIFVPESIIRKHHFTHGDVISFVPTGQTASGATLYDYTLVKKEPSKRLENSKQVFTRGVIEKVPTTNNIDPMYYVEADANGTTLSVDGNNKTYTLSEEDLNRFHVAEGDLVDIAWYNMNFSGTARVVWKYAEQLTNA